MFYHVTSLELGGFLYICILFKGFPLEFTSGMQDHNVQSGEVQLTETWKLEVISNL